MRKKLMLTEPCCCVAEIILLLSFSNCSPQPRSPLALLRLHCEAEWKELRPKLPQPVSLLQTQCPHPRLQVEKMANIKPFANLLQRDKFNGHLVPFQPSGAQVFFALTLRPGGPWSPQNGGFCGSVAFWGAKTSNRAFCSVIPHLALQNATQSFLLCDTPIWLFKKPRHLKMSA